MSSLTKVVYAPNMEYMIIYKITNGINGKVYIGQTVQKLTDRWSDHSRPCTGHHVNDSAIACAIRKYGKDNFVVEQIDSAKDRNSLNVMEQTYIKAFNSLAPNGYNLELGGNSKECHPDTKAKISATLKGTPIANRWTKGNLTPRTDETKAKISASMTGVPQPWKYKKVLAIETGTVYESVNAAAKVLGLNRVTISGLIKSGKVSRLGLRFKFI